MILVALVKTFVNRNFRAPYESEWVKAPVLRPPASHGE